MKKEFGPKNIKKILKSAPNLKPMKGIHSEIHALAKEISEYCNEPKKFALYLGIIKRIGKKRAYQIFSQIKRSKDIKTPAKLFMFLSKKENIVNENRNRKK